MVTQTGLCHAVQSLLAASRFPPRVCQPMPDYTQIPIWFLCRTFYINCKRVHALHAVASIDAIVAMCAGNMKLSVFT